MEVLREKVPFMINEEEKFKQSAYKLTTWNFEALLISWYKSGKKKNEKKTKKEENKATYLQAGQCHRILRPIWISIW